MADGEVKYQNKTATTVRGLEARSIAKWEKDRWELVSQTPAPLLRSTLFFRRVKKPLKWYVWGAPVGALVLCMTVLVVMSVIEQNAKSDAPALTAAAVSTPTSVATPTSTGTASPTPVTDAEIVSAFKSYFAERAAGGSMWGKAANEVTFVNRAVHVTFDPAASGVDQATFDSFVAGFDFPSFIATPIAFNDDLGNGLRPAIDSIDAVRVDGTLLGTIDSKGILELNGLSR
jgi:hypothetical protein